VLLLGNHDEWLLKWFLTGETPGIWLSQGGFCTISSWVAPIPESHINLLKGALLFYELENKLFVHGGIIPGKYPSLTSREVLLWDRSLVKTALELKFSGRTNHITKYDEIYVGHTPTINFQETVPIKACEVYLMDTGAAWPGGVLTIMNIDTKEYFASDLVTDLYQHEASAKK
jgi:serine/threonine protein phosphatase 1